MNYPNKKITTYTKKANDIHSRLGMKLEEDINTTNKYYLNHDIAIIYKKPTPIKITKVSYKKRSAAKITEAYFKDPSTTDYNGIYKGKYIDFEAKESHSKTSFSINLIHKHQLQHLFNVSNHGAIAFVILRMVIHNKTYLIKSSDLYDFIKSTTRKSIPYLWILENGYEINSKYTCPCDYISVIEEVYNKEFK